MENTTLSSVLDSLRNQESILLEHVDAHRSQLQEEQARLSRVRNAIKALEETQPKEEGNKKPAPTRTVVQTLLVQQRESCPNESSEAIREGVKAKLVDAGYSLAG